MAVTWTISTLERNSTDDGVIVAHWRATDSEVVGDETHTGTSYGTCGFTPDPDADGYTPYEDITEIQAVGWVIASMGDTAVAALEASIAAQIEESKAPAVAVGTPW